jgi:hypothetical protein
MRRYHGRTKLDSAMRVTGHLRITFNRQDLLRAFMVDAVIQRMNA